METCFVYLRKSTNRKDKQQLSFEMQLNWINELFLKNPNYEVIWLDWKIYDIPSEWFIFESESAKQWWKPRPKFHKMLELIEKIECDYLVVFQPNRISRNTDDMSSFIKLFEWKEKKIHKAIITENNTYDVHNQKHVNDLEYALMEAKKDNVTKSAIIKSAQKIDKKNWIYTHRFPFWYKNIWKNDIEIDTEKMLLVELAFNWRLNWCSFKEISDEFLKKWYKKSWDWIKKILSNPVYTWRFDYNWEEKAIKNSWFKVIIDKVTFDKVQKYNEENKRKHWKQNPNDKNNNSIYLKKMVFDVMWVMLQPYKNKKNWKIYYRQPTKNYNYKINISEQKLFTKMETEIDNFKLSEEIIIILKETFLSKISVLELEQKAEIRDIKSKIDIKNNDIENRLSEIWKITDERVKTRFMNSLSSLEDEIEKLQEELEKKENKKINYEELIEKYLKLFKDLPWTYKKSPKSEKANILRWLWIRFIVWIDKSIDIEWWEIQNLFKSLS